MHHTSTTRQLNDAQRTQVVRDVITRSGEHARQQHAWLSARHQDTVGLLIQLSSVAGIVAGGWMYVQGWMTWWMLLPWVGVLASLTHEMEHDLIHQMYFKNRPWVQNLLLLLGWLARPTSINPWMRRGMHFHHHKQSGQKGDIEERSITNGERWGLKRLLMTADGDLALFLRLPTMTKMARAYVRANQPSATPRQLRRATMVQGLVYLPIGSLCWTCWHVFLLFHGLTLAGQALNQPITWPAAVLSAMHWVDLATIILVAPNVLRSFCLHFISSNMHYYGDVKPGHVIQQCQVLNHPLLWPIQLFAFNFGSTHAIHHFVVGQPFYLRQFIAGDAHAVMRQMGVRFNDWGTFTRANRLGLQAA